MLILNGTAFMLYGLFGYFGPFHVAALFSLTTLLLGIIPVLSRRPKSKWLMRHFTFMYFSIIGLYAAFASETLTRIPKSPFFTMVIIATLVITALGVMIYNKMRSQWIREFASIE
jgi:peptidoglycan/LPS O-acetylase OafA/YrhL